LKARLIGRTPWRQDSLLPFNCHPFCMASTPPSIRRHKGRGSGAASSTGRMAPSPPLGRCWRCVLVRWC
jgi:hypothetical protein